MNSFGLKLNRECKTHWIKWAKKQPTNNECYWQIFDYFKLKTVNGLSLGVIAWCEHAEFVLRSTASANYDLLSI